jgi:hypothetical protein
MRRLVRLATLSTTIALLLAAPAAATVYRAPYGGTSYDVVLCGVRGDLTEDATIVDSSLPTETWRVADRYVIVGTFEFEPNDPTEQRARGHFVLRFVRTHLSEAVLQERLITIHTGTYEDGSRYLSHRTHQATYSGYFEEVRRVVDRERCATAPS